MILPSAQKAGSQKQMEESSLRYQIEVKIWRTCVCIVTAGWGGLWKAGGEGSHNSGSTGMASKGSHENKMK